MVKQSAIQPEVGGSSPTSPLQFSFKDLQVRHISRADGDWLVQRHYLHKWPAIVLSIFGLFHNNICVGVCVYSAPAIKVNQRYRCSVWELARLWLVDEMPKNSETWFIAKTILLLKKERIPIDGIVS